MSERIIVSLLLALIAITQLSFGLPRIAPYSAVDEHLWTYERVPQFWKAIKQDRWEKTNINDKPGITTAWVSGIGMLAVDPEPHEDLRVEKKDSATVSLIEKINTAFRSPIYLFTLLFLPVFYFLLRKLLGFSAALFGTAFIYLSPIILGISLIINPDSLLWIFLPLSIISFLVFQKHAQSKYAYACGVFFGLALLTKYVSAILFVYLPIIIFLAAIFSPRIADTRDYLKQSFAGYAKMILVSIVTVFLLYPATWVRPELIVETTFLSHPFEPIWKYFAIVMGTLFLDVFLFKSFISARVVHWIIPYRRVILGMVFGVVCAGISFAFMNAWLGMRLYDFQSALTSARILDVPFSFSLIAVRGIATGFFVLLFSVPPVILFCAFFAIGNAIFLIWKKEWSDDLMVVSAFFLFMLSYYAASAMNSVQPTVRYQIALYPMIAIIAGIGLHWFLKQLSALRVIPHVVASLFLIGILSLSLFLVRPYYFSYASGLLPNQYVVNMKDMGDGSYEAAQYLNAQAGAKDMHIWSDKVAVCEYFVGSCEVSLKQKNLEGIRFDYFVISNGREPKTRYFISIRNIVLPEFLRLQELYTSDDFEGHTIVIDGRPGNFVKIVKNSVTANH